MHDHLSKLKKPIEEVLRYDPSDEQRAAYFRVGGDWTKASEYPPIIPLENYRKEDFLRLAWEILRRSPRYRHQYRKLKEFGIKKSTFSGFIGESYFSNTIIPDFDGWEDIPLLGHQCIPAKSSLEQTFGEYVAERQAGEVWLVMNRRRWVMDLWGLKYLPDPDKSFLKLKKKDLFMAPAGAIQVENSDVNSPRMVSTYAGQNEVVFKLRLDAPLENQLLAIKREAMRLQSFADGHAKNVAAPFSLPRSKRTSKILAEIRGEQGVAVPDYDERYGRVLLKQLELCPIWLRTWDAVQEAKTEQADKFELKLLGKHQWPRIDRVALVSKFVDDYLSKANTVTQTVVYKDIGGTTEKEATYPLFEDVTKSLKPRLVPNWRERSEKYIEGGDDAYRQLVAMAFANSGAD